MEFNIKLLFVITSMVLNFNAAAKEKISLLAPYDEWYFNFFYPNSLPAEVTYVELLDTDGGNDSNFLIVFYVQIMPDDFVMQLHRF